MRILLVEDNTALASALIKALMTEGFDVSHVLHGERAVANTQNQLPDALVLDLGLPDIDGLDVLKKIKQANPTVPVLLLTARDTLEDKVTGLNAGADDYLAKPFEMPELIARLRVIQRRLLNSIDPTIQVGAVTLFTNEHKVMVNNSEVELSRREYALLKILMSSLNKVVTRTHLEAQLYSWGDDVSSNALEVHVHNLRKKLGKEFIQTIRGVGYSVKSR